MYYGEKNAFILEIFAMRKGLKPHWSLDFLEAAFDCFPDLDYCMILLPFSRPPYQFLQHFVVLIKIVVSDKRTRKEREEEESSTYLTFETNFPRARRACRSGATGISRWCCTSCTERFFSGRLSVVAPKCEIEILYKDFWPLYRRSIRLWLISTLRWILCNSIWIVSSSNATIQCSGSLYCGCYI